MNKVITDDGSITFRNSELDECYHTKSGALDEALRKHVIPSGILDVENVVIADICFGLGYNSLVALHEIWKKNPVQKITLYAFENDSEIMSQLKDINLGEMNDVRDIFVKLINEGEYSDHRLKAKMFLGDFRSEMKKVSGFTVVFFDPFSPQKVPELWSLEVFSDLYLLCAPGCVLTTYSCARLVRDGLKGAGFIVSDGPTIGRRSPSTIARKPF